MNKQINKRELDYWTSMWEDNKIDFKACEDFWNNRASSFNESVNSKNQNTEKLIVALKEKGILNYNSNVLDIGCGPGTHAIPMAKKCKEVVAMDISQNMLDHLEKKAEVLELGNIQTIKANWADIDLEDYNWCKKFDLVFAAMSPAIYNFETLKKMCDASRGYCYISGWVKRINKIEDALYEVLNKKGSETGILEDKIYFVFNILWNMGYHPEVTYSQRKWSGIQDFEEAVENYTKKIMIKNPLTEEEKEKIRQRLVLFKEKDKIEEESEAIVGTIIWQI